MADGSPFSQHSEYAGRALYNTMLGLIVLQHVEDEALLDRLAHGVEVLGFRALGLAGWEQDYWGGGYTFLVFLGPISLFISIALIGTVAEISQKLTK